MLTSISFKKDKNATQIIGETSTPKAGGTSVRVAFKNGSVGHESTLVGNLFKFTWGYQDKTIRQRKAREDTFKKIPTSERVGDIQDCGEDSSNALTAEGSSNRTPIDKTKGKAT